MTDVQAAYAARAAEYSDALGSMDAVHPSDRQLVDTWASTVSGRVLDAGSGPGHWTDYLGRRGLDVQGIDIVPEFLDRARTRYPSARFDTGSIDAIDEPDDAFGGILSWFSTIHHEPSRISIPLLQFARALRPGGTLLLGYFDGAEVEPFDHAVVRAYRWPARELIKVLDAAGFDVIETHRRTERGRRDVGAILCERRAR
ncbi:class I SAM-dependent methyltransferase [Microbacterium hominis]|uniref:class I SAM-dependent methyltransferase n=1 Tax=Microbacterium hominis TaxID=162426 RepID=UPI0019628378|nr:class I SAM-dependent methyltransferase [Microbacterium hominis]QRY39464.1 class I SAM-dependent methyltransferase [Microbacterium hominis]